MILTTPVYDIYQKINGIKFPKFQFTLIFRVQVMHDYVHMCEINIRTREFMLKMALILYASEYC